MTMIIVFAMVGLMVGAVIAEVPGALAGAALGFAIGSHLNFRKRLDQIEGELARVARERFVESAPPAAPRHPALRESLPPVVPVPRQPPVHRPLFDDPQPARQPAFESAQSAPAEILAPRRRVIRPAEPFIVVQWVRDYFTGGNLVVRTGIIVLFFGVAFLLKFAADRNLMPIELRLAGVALGGAALLTIGWRLRLRQRAYALALQGGGVGLLYLTAFAALRLYDLLPPTLTFAMLVAVAALSAFLAIGQNSPALILLGVTGGFLAPVLASTGQGNHVVLFSYYALLDAGVVAIAWFKAWRQLNVLAFVFTFGIGTAWGALKYAPENFATTEPFLVLFFVMFLAVAILFAKRTAPQLTDYVDGTLLFGTPVVTMMLQSALVRGRPYAMAFSALALSAVYLGLAAATWRAHRQQLGMLAHACLALGVAFVTLAVPLALDGHWTAATWALEGAAILWVGVRQERKLAIAAGALLQLGAALSFAVKHDVVVSHLPLVNSRCLGALFIAIGGLATARVLRGYFERLGPEFRRIPLVPVCWGLAWWLGAGIGEFERFLPERDFWPAVLALATVTALGCAALSHWDDWREMRQPTLLLLVAMLLSAMGAAPTGHLLDGMGVIAWPLAVAAWIWILRWRERHARLPVEDAIHVASLWLLVALLSVELSWQVEQAGVGDAAWHLVMSALPAAAALSLITAGAKRAWWPIAAFPTAYGGFGAAGFAVYLWLWSLGANLSDGSARPLPYLPIANPIELTQLFALAAIAGRLLHLARAAPAYWRSQELVAALWPAFGLALFAFLTAVLLRVLHHYFGVPYEIDALLQSTLVQSALSIFWGFIALSGMVIGTRARQRPVWFAGAALLAVVLAKMFLVDLSRTGTVARIVSFIGVGVLMLIIGRFSPVPPAMRTEEAKT